MDARLISESNGHKYDVFRLLQIADRSQPVAISGQVKENTERFLREIAGENIQLAQIGLPFDKQEALETLNALYMEQ